MIPFASHLERVILDDPQKVVGNISTYDMALKVLQTSAETGKVAVKIEKRQCQDGCRCVGNYANNWNNHQQMF